MNEWNWLVVWLVLILEFSILLYYWKKDKKRELERKRRFREKNKDLIDYVNKKYQTGV